MSAIVSILEDSSGIGYKGKKCIELKESLKRFTMLTTGTGALPNLLVMGYNTCSSLAEFPLPNRHNVVLTRRHLSFVNDLRLANVTALASFTELEDYLARFKDAYNEVWFIGE